MDNGMYTRQDQVYKHCEQAVTYALMSHVESIPKNTIRTLAVQLARDADGHSVYYYAHRPFAI